MEGELQDPKVTTASVSGLSPSSLLQHESNLPGSPTRRCFSCSPGTNRRSQAGAHPAARHHRQNPAANLARAFLLSFLLPRERKKKKRQKKNPNKTTTPNRNRSRHSHLGCSSSAGALPPRCSLRAARNGGEDGPGRRLLEVTPRPVLLHCAAPREAPARAPRPAPGAWAALPSPPVPEAAAAAPFPPPSWRTQGCSRPQTGLAPPKPALLLAGPGGKAPKCSRCPRDPFQMVPGRFVSRGGSRALPQQHRLELRLRQGEEQQRRAFLPRSSSGAKAGGENSNEAKTKQQRGADLARSSPPAPFVFPPCVPREPHHGVGPQRGQEKGGQIHSLFSLLMQIEKYLTGREQSSKCTLQRLPFRYGSRRGEGEISASHMGLAGSPTATAKKCFSSLPFYKLSLV